MGAYPASIQMFNNGQALPKGCDSFSPTKRQILYIMISVKIEEDCTMAYSLQGYIEQGWQDLWRVWMHVRAWFWCFSGGQAACT